MSGRWFATPREVRVVVIYPMFAQKGLQRGLCPFAGKHIDKKQLRRYPQAPLPPQKLPGAFARFPHETLRNLAPEPHQTTPEPIWAETRSISAVGENQPNKFQQVKQGPDGFPISLLFEPASKLKLSALSVPRQSTSTLSWNRRGCFTVKAAIDSLELPGPRSAPDCRAR